MTLKAVESLVKLCNLSQLDIVAKLCVLLCRKGKCSNAKALKKEYEQEQNRKGNNLNIKL